MIVVKDGIDQPQVSAADAAFVGGLVQAADAYVDALLTADDGGVAALPHRAAMSRLLALATVYTEPGSAHRGAPGLPAAMAACVARLEHLQGPTGLFDGTNLSSPPDSAFTINDACMALEIMDAAKDGGIDDGGAARDGGGADGGLADVRRRLRAVVGRITDALVTGGVHTPNHRWELCAALARIHALQEREGSPRPEISERIGQWLAEGIDQLPDGMYSERSPLYATAVTNPSLLAIADCAGRAELLEHVRGNLAAFLPWFNADGSIESLFSRRQDQWFTFDGESFQLLYRRMANQDGRADFAAAAAWLQQFPLLEPAKALARTRLDPWLGSEFPAAPGVLDGGLPPVMAPDRAELATCGVHRFRKAGNVVTVFGGCDELVPGVVSGLSSNPTFLRLAHGDAVLTDVRLSRSFFDLGPFRSQTVSADPGAGTVRLSEEQRANFYLPLPPEKHRQDGIYALVHEGRFSASMDFGHRPTVEHRLSTAISVHTGGGAGGDVVEVELDFGGADTSFALELTFRPGGELTGVAGPAVVPSGASGGEAFQLTSGTGSYRVGDDAIEFGPGIPADPDNPPLYNPGEAYRYLSGTNATDGVRVYITGRTRGTHRFTLRGRSLS
ncbi:hypothetical protein [Arthrobacter sp. BE255]|uniref:hypothetical protein n=1 Tax=Arthrobacter sp. BE255 TaxID=2817721 RepID=UPI002866352D|nr:hypothetical protein [Arthrobacter sp. BE255]MDR7160012.1 hypothetical protein [Arthrobacter sp. BE255]